LFIYHNKYQIINSKDGQQSQLSKQGKEGFFFIKEKPNQKEIQGQKQFEILQATHLKGCTQAQVCQIYRRP
jgi:hypothetical protein